LLTQRPTSTSLYSTFAADGSEYSSNDSGDMDEEAEALEKLNSFDRQDFEDDAAGETVELGPVPMSKNTGNRFVSLVWDRLLDTKGRDALDLHYDRIALTEDHVMFCRKANLYNETFNTESMVDVLWSLPILSSDLQRVIGHAMCMESQELHHVQSFLKEEPIINMLTGGDLTEIPIYRWRHIRDYTLRIDDGRFGFPCLCLAMDDEPEQVGNLRQEMKEDTMEYLIRSRKVIAAGPLHLPTEFKDDPSSIPVGDLMLFNAKDRADAIDFCENTPNAQEGLYKDLRVHFYNTLDVTGKFVSEDPLSEQPCGDMKEAMEYWGYPVEDNQTPWLNW